ncbi:MAG: hypothetical protein QXU98_06085 [Candidatus Parvarchaeota archaeon]
MNDDEIMELYTRYFDGKVWDTKGNFTPQAEKWLKEMLNQARYDEKTKILDLFEQHFTLSKDLKIFIKKIRNDFI